nr:TonB-dependent receptor [Gemmatimonadota bacterium]
MRPFRAFLPIHPSVQLFSILTILLLLLPLPVNAQAQATGSISGTVVDENGAPVVGAIIESTGQDHRHQRRVVADSRGVFRLIAVPAGRYELRVTHIGYRPSGARSVQVRGGETATLTVTLSLAPVELETVDVIATPITIRRTDTEFETKIEERAIALLPVGHDPKDLVALTPGARPGQVWGGSSMQANNFQIDGVAANHPGVGGDLIRPSINWVEAVEVRGLGAGAEYGNFQGGLINVITRSGSNSFGGAFRSNIETHHLNRSNLQQTEVGSEIAQRWQGEGEVQGPIVRNRLFFFLAGGLVEQDSRFMNHLPDFEGKYSPVMESQQERRFFGKLTWRPTGKDNFNLSVARVDTDADFAGLSGYEVADATLHVTAPTQFSQLTWQRTWSRRTTLDVRIASFERDEVRTPYGGHDVPGVQVYGREPARTYQNPPIRYRQAPESLSGSAALSIGFNTLSWEHQLKVGGEHSRGSWVDQRTRNGGMTWRAVPSRRFSPADPGSWAFAGLIPTDWGGEVDLHAEVENSAIYLQDNIDLSSRLTLTPGLRYGRWTGRLLPGGDRTARFSAVEDAAAEARIGAIFDVTGDNRFVAKAHWGRYHQSLLAQLFDRAEGGNVFTNEQLWYYRGSPPADPRMRFSVAERDSLAREGIFTLAEEIRLNESGPVENYRQPYVDQWIIGLEKMLGKSVKAEAVYVNRRNRQMVALVDRNLDSNYTVYEKVRVFNAGGDTLRYLGRPLVLQRLYIPNNVVREHIISAANADGFQMPPGMSLADVDRLTFNPDYVLTNVPDASRRFDQLQLTVQGGFPRWGVTSSLVFTRLEGNLDNVSGYEDPAGYGAGPYVRPNEQVNRYGTLQNSSDLELKVAVYGELLPAPRRGVLDALRRRLLHAALYAFRRRLRLSAAHRREDRRPAGDSGRGADGARRAAGEPELSPARLFRFPRGARVPGPRLGLARVAGCVQPLQLRHHHRGEHLRQRGKIHRGALGPHRRSQRLLPG